MEGTLIAEQYIKQKKVGSGTYGIVYQAIEKTSNQIVALKKIKIDSKEEGFPPSARREIGILMEMKLDPQNYHDNIIRLRDVIENSSQLYLVFDFVDWDLKHFMDKYCSKMVKGVSQRTHGLPLKNVKSLLRQLLSAVSFCHSKMILHRDIKPSNCLVTAYGVLKLADFGLARTIGIPCRTLSHEIVTLYYRAPEIILGCQFYSFAIDCWSIGCILCEMITGQVLFSADSEIDLLFNIFRRLGTPNNANWPGVEKFVDYCTEFPKFKSKGFVDLRLNSSALALVKSLLVYPPATRIEARTAMKHQFLQNATVNEPLPNIPLRVRSSSNNCKDDEV